jgi:DNA ligase 1
MKQEDHNMRTQPDWIIRRLEEHNSRLDKEAIIKDAVDEQLDEFFDGIKLALNSMITFGVKQVPVKEEIWIESQEVNNLISKKLEPNGQGLAWSVFVDLAEKLRTRELTGHDARDAIELAMSVATTQQWNDWYRRILIKDLRCGVSVKTVNKVCKDHPQYQVPVYTCMLAHDSAKHEKKMKGRKQIEIKLDGVRTQMIVRDPHGEKIEMFSRDGKQFHNFDHVIEQVREVLKNNPAPYPLVLDGEMMSATFQDLMRQVHRKENVEAGDAVLNLFDIIPLEQFLKGKWEKPQHERSNLVKHWVDQHQSQMPQVAVLGWETVDLDTPEGEARFVEINRLALKHKYEGVMIKDPDAPYECKRTHSWLKAKPFIEVTLEITALEEGTGKNAGRLGALVCAGEDDGRDIKVNVGSGFTDDLRSSIWAAGDAVIGQLVEVRADAVTQNKDRTYSLRFPRFKTFRGFKPGEKL